MIVSNVIFVKVNFLEVHHGLNHTWPELKIAILLSVKLCLNLFKKKLIKQLKGQTKNVKVHQPQAVLRRVKSPQLQYKKLRRKKLSRMCLSSPNSIQSCLFLTKPYF